MPQPPPVEYIEVPKVDAKTAATLMASLRDVAVPPPVSWRPQTAGWYVVGALLLAGLLWMALRQYRRWQAQRYRRDALSALQALEPALADPARRVVALRQMAELVKRTQLSETERQAVASLSGVVWLKALDKGWPLKRVEALVRAVLRAGAFELQSRKDIPARVIVSEYVDVANAFVDRDETGMVNAVLDILARSARAEEFGHKAT